MPSFNIKDFYSKRFELESTQLLLENSIFFSQKAMEHYIHNITHYPLMDFIVYAIENPNKSEISSKDITQLSSLDDCTTNMCNMMLSSGNCGLTLPNIASGLHADKNYKDNLVALTKYGENQVKTACQLGLTVIRNNLWYLSSVGAVFPFLHDEFKRKYLSISLLRDPFYSKVICRMYQQETNLLDFMTILSKTTQQRRASSCMRLIDLFVRQCEEETINIHPIIIKSK